jgi:hypothetical protein
VLTVNSVKALFQKAPPAKKTGRNSTVALYGEDGRSSGQGWTTKYAPNSREELAVHNKKVEVCDFDLIFLQILPSCQHRLHVLHLCLCQHTLDCDRE